MIILYFFLRDKSSILFLIIQTISFIHFKLFLHQNWQSGKQQIQFIACLAINILINLDTVESNVVIIGLNFGQQKRMCKNLYYKM